MDPVDGYAIVVLLFVLFSFWFVRLVKAESRRLAAETAAADAAET